MKGFKTIFKYSKNNLIDQIFSTRFYIQLSLISEFHYACNYSVQKESNLLVNSFDHKVSRK